MCCCACLLTTSNGTCAKGPPPSCWTRTTRSLRTPRALPSSHRQSSRPSPAARPPPNARPRECTQLPHTPRRPGDHRQEPRSTETRRGTVLRFGHQAAAGAAPGARPGRRQPVAYPVCDSTKRWFGKPLQRLISISAQEVRANQHHKQLIAQGSEEPRP